MRHVPHKEHVAGVLLAAGQGTRFGGDKLVARLDGEPLVRHAAAMLVRAGVRELVVVVGPDSGSIEGALSEVLECGPHSPVHARIVVNPHAAKGLGTSVAAGIGALGPPVEAALVALGDQPRVPDEVPRALLAAWRGTGAPIVAPRYQGGVRGNPVLFDATGKPRLDLYMGDELHLRPRAYEGFAKIIKPVLTRAVGE